ncbi:restriction endonuclease [Campylobacter gastrosuis]|uniref:Restriction endonuclease n=1 Tax=Campylobacter gastrosuis TaxID=2974576 RepID=A0ABT7HNK9_9BACT|nr:restriction endonuclease [Campylobacter gastrosuis]MDL0088496.1 restriction endonuclease [Campylobacter gastrosuis]
MWQKIFVYLLAGAAVIIGWFSFLLLGQSKNSLLPWYGIAISVILFFLTNYFEKILIKDPLINAERIAQINQFDYQIKQYVDREKILPSKAEYIKRYKIDEYIAIKEKYIQIKNKAREDETTDELKYRYTIFKEMLKKQSEIATLWQTLSQETEHYIQKINSIKIDFFIDKTNDFTLEFRNFNLSQIDNYLSSVRTYNKNLVPIGDSFELLIQKHDILKNILDQAVYLEQQYYRPCVHNKKMAYLSPHKCKICKKEFDSFIKKQNPKQYAQKILDRYEDEMAFRKPEEIGARYERYIGYLYEISGYDVTYNGIIMGKKDDGIDIIAKKKNEMIIIQCKWYKEESEIHNNTIRQLNDNLNDYTQDNPNKKVIARLYSVYDNLDEQAKAKIARTQIEHIILPYDNNYPKIKCNTNKDTNEKIYHLPGVGQYDRIKMHQKNKFYIKTISEAEKLGFRLSYN